MTSAATISSTTTSVGQGARKWSDAYDTPSVATAPSTNSTVATMSPGVCSHGAMAGARRRRTASLGVGGGLMTLGCPAGRSPVSVIDPRLAGPNVTVHPLSRAYLWRVRVDLLHPPAARQLRRHHDRRGT